MKNKIISTALMLAFSLNPCAAWAQTNENEPDVLREIFSGIDDADPELKSDRLPYLDGTYLSDIREPLYMYEGGQKIFGESDNLSASLSWRTSSSLTLKRGTVKIAGVSYSLSGQAKFLAAYEGDFDGDGRKNELAVIAAAKTTDNRSLMLLCTAAAAGGTAEPVAVLYDGEKSTADFYANTDKFVNSIALVCADINGDGYDEIVTSTPTGGHTNRTSDEYGFDNFGGSYVWSMTAENRTDTSWQSADNWCGEPTSLYNGLRGSVEGGYLGAPGSTATMAEGDIDGDGYDDLVIAIATTKAKYNANYESNMYSVLYIGGAPTVSEMYAKRRHLIQYMDGDIVNKLYLQATSGDASGFGVAIADVDGSGKPTIFLSIKQTVHRWAAYSGEKMYAPNYYIYSFDYNKEKDNFTASYVYDGGIYHHGWVDSTAASDSDYLYKTKPEDCAPIRIGVLRNDFGLSDGQKGYISSGTLIVDQKYIPFVRKPNGNSYSYDAKDIGSYTGEWGTDRAGENLDYQGTNCIFYNNGINVSDIRTADISFNGEKYEDAAIVRAYTASGYRTYYIRAKDNGYVKYPTSSVLGESTSYAAAAMPDIDSDSVYLKYNKHQFFWSDPVIIAALASPPYFDSLPSDMYTNSQTTYGKSTAASSGKTQSYTVSVGTYVSAEIKAGGLGTAGVFESEGEALKSSTLEDGETKEVSYTQSFSTSGGEDTVVLSTVAYDAYAYTAYYQGADGSQTSSPYIVYVPRNGSDSIKIASLNYEDYLEFIPYAKGALPDMSNVFTHTPGKPETYPNKAPSGINVVTNSVMTYPKTAGFPSNTGSQTLSIDITEETSQVTSSGSSVSAKLGGGVESEADDIFTMASAGSKITVGSISEKEYEGGKIQTNAVGTTFEGTVFGQGDGMNVSGNGEKKADFNWKLLHYVYNFKEDTSVQQFPVVTYITSGVVQPEGVVPTSVKVTPESRSIEQVGPKTPGYANEKQFTVTAEGVTREANTELIGAPLGMTMVSGGNVGTSAPFTFGIRINGNVKPGEYELKLKVGGVESNKFKVIVTEYEVPTWIEADKTEIDFGSMRYNYSKGTPAADAQIITIRNIYTEQVTDLAASLGEDSPFEIKEDLSSTLLYPKDLANSTATISVAPKKGLEIGTYTDTLTVSNGVTAAYVTLKYTVTNPGIPNPPNFKNTFSPTPNPIKLDVNAPDDDGGARMLYYLYTLKDHEDYLENGEQVWKKVYSTAQSGSSFYLNIPEELTVGERYTVGVKAVNEIGESDAAWFEFEVSMAANDPDPVKNLKVYESDGKIALTWDEPDSWGENKYVPEVYFKHYQVFCYQDGNYVTHKWIDATDEPEWSYDNAENGKKYSISVYSETKDNSTLVTVDATPAAGKIIAPSRPSGFSAEMSYKTAKLTWNAPITDGGAQITGYKVSKNGGATWTDVGNVLQYTFENLTTNTEYDFRACAVNSVGMGDAAKTAATAPSSLQMLTVNDVIEGYEQLELDWQPSIDEGVIGYEVRVDNGEWKRIEPVLYDGTLRYIFTGLTNDKDYKLSVRAVDSEGGGPEVSRTRKPSSLAPKPVKNAAVKPGNAAIQLFGEQEDGVSMKYKVDGERYWWTYSSGYKTTGYENGKTYTVAIATEGRDEYGFTLRTTQYLTVTPDASIPDKPSYPIIDAFIDDDYIRLEWRVESDGGSAIKYYELSYDDNSEPIILPGTENTFLLRCTKEERANYRHISVKAVNAVGENSDSVYIPNAELTGENKLILPKERSEVFTSVYKMMIVYILEGEDGNPIYETADASDAAEWSLDSDKAEITWDNDNKQIIIGKDLADGAYEVCLKAEYHGATFEKKVEIIVGAEADIISAQKVSGGISAVLDLPQNMGEVVLCAATYGSDKRLTDVSILKVSSESLTDGEILIPIDWNNAATAKVMLLKDMNTLKPLCENKAVE